MTTPQQPTPPVEPEGQPEVAPGEEQDEDYFAQLDDVRESITEGVITWW